MARHRRPARFTVRGLLRVSEFRGPLKPQNPKPHNPKWTFGALKTLNPKPHNPKPHLNPITLNPVTLNLKTLRTPNRVQGLGLLPAQGLQRQGFYVARAEVSGPRVEPGLGLRVSGARDVRGLEVVGLGI